MIYNLPFEKEFLSPGAKWRGKPFWAWNGKLEKDEILRQVDIAAEMGFGGFFMHSRTGLVTEYLSDEWFDLINACADYASEKGLEAWLYDEDRWPSGIAGGIVTEKPEYRAKYIRLSICDKDSFKWNKGIIAAFQAELEGLNAVGVKKINVESEITKQKVLFFTIEEMGSNTFYNGYTYIDTLKREATEQFLSSTHEMYAKKCGSRLGTSIKGIFTDEPNRGEIMAPFFGCNPMEDYIAPWTDALPEEFEKAFGYSLLDSLAELFLIIDGNRISQVKWHYVELLQRLYIDNFAKPINDWCKKHNIILTGHVLHEDSLTSQTQVFGSVMRAYEYMGYPGVDILTENNKSYWVAKQVQSVAGQLGQEFVLSELYGCTGWQMTFENYKHVGDWQALFGINLRCPHISWYTMEGEAKRDYPASIFHQAGWHKEYRCIEDYFARIAVATSGQRDCRLLIINPVESVWAQVYPGWASILSSRSEAVTALEEQYSQLFHRLCNSKLDFDYGDEDMLMRLSKLSEKDGKPILTLGKAQYEVVLISGAETIRSTTLDILQAFAAIGGKVIFAGTAPGYVDAVKSPRPEELSHSTTSVSLEGTCLEELLHGLLGHSISVFSEENCRIDDIWVQSYNADGQKVYFLLNMNREMSRKNVRIEIPVQSEANIKAVVLNCLTGRILDAECKKDNKKLIIHHSFEAGGELLLALVPETFNASSTVKCTITQTKHEVFPENIGYSMKEDNICVLDMARWRTDGGEWQREEEILKLDRAVRNKYGLPIRGGVMVQPWFRNKYFGKEDTVKVCSLETAFEFYVEKIPKCVRLAIEAPEMWEISLNGKELKSVNNDWWVDKCYKLIDIDEANLVRGKNELVLKCGFTAQHNPEAVFLLGDFGVRIEGTSKYLIEGASNITEGDIKEQGLPFYSGSLVYRYKLPEECAEKPFKVRLGRFGGAFARIGTQLETKLLPWSPYEACFSPAVGELSVEVFITRRNTFGPLHQVPLYTPWYGPENFVWEGELFSYNYNLVDNGLFDSVTILY